MSAMARFVYWMTSTTAAAWLAVAAPAARAEDAPAVKPPALPPAEAPTTSAPGSAPSATKPADPFAGGGSPEAVDALRELVAHQKAVLAEANESSDAGELEEHRTDLQKIADRYEALLGKHPDFAALWAAYGLFLCEPVLEDRRAALPLLLRANALDPGLAVVKNQIGVIMAEDGRVTDALNYFLAASDLVPTEPLYHFQIGLLIDEARDVFVNSRAWRRPDLDRTMLAAFSRAVALAPERTDFAYRAAESYYDLAEPRWDEAYAAWSALEDRLEGKIEIQAVRLHMAKVRWKQGRAADARELLESVDEPTLAVQKANLRAEFAAADAHATSEIRADADADAAPRPAGK